MAWVQTSRCSWDLTCENFKWNKLCRGPQGPRLRAALLSNFNESLSLRIFQEERLFHFATQCVILWDRGWDSNAADLGYWIHRSIFVMSWLAISELQTQDWFVPKALVPNSTWLKDFESTTRTPHGNVWPVEAGCWLLHLNEENKW